MPSKVFFEEKNIISVCGAWLRNHDQGGFIQEVSLSHCFSWKNSTGCDPSHWAAKRAPGAFIYEYGDHGGLVVMADDVRKTKLVGGAQCSGDWKPTKESDLPRLNGTLWETRII